MTERDPRMCPVDEMEWLAERFESHRAHLRAVAYQMLGSLTEADDAVQEAWLRLSRADTSGVNNLGSCGNALNDRVQLRGRELEDRRFQAPQVDHAAHGIRKCVAQPGAEDPVDVVAGTRGHLDAEVLSVDLAVEAG